MTVGILVLISAEHYSITTYALYSAAGLSPILLSVLKFCFRFLTPSCPRICHDSPSCIMHTLIWWHY